VAAAARRPWIFKMSTESVTFRVYLHGEDPNARGACDLRPYAAYFTCRRHPVTGRLRVRLLPPFANIRMDHGERLNARKTAQLMDALRVLRATITTGDAHGA
jgi:hypothetical protein